MTTLVLVESPNKVKKLAHYLGAGFDVLPTVGHVRDLPAHELGVDLATFLPSYEILDAKKAVVSRIRAAAAKADDVLLATDPDREGEAISWHVAQVLRLKNPRRLTYQEITEKALKAALAKVRPLDQARVDSQQARRVLDRLVGYQVSPLLRPFGTNHSAGRVQSAVLHAIVQRERERERFNPEPYWTLAARYAEGFKARYATVDEEGHLADTRAKTEDEAKAIAARARGPHEVAAVERADRERKPRPPLTTAELLKLAGSKLGLKLDETMRLAQALFEGGAITYHRTDSVTLSDDAVAMAREFIGKDYPEALPAAPPRYKAAADAQEAHEAIRPTSLEPELAAGLPDDQRALFELIRNAFLASQCKPAVIAQTVVTITSGDTTWRAVGSTVKFPSFLRYLDPDEQKDAEQGPEPKLPPLAPGQRLTLEDIEVARQETKPPPRYTEASIIEFMKKTCIGRPSTYAATIAVLFRREYIALEKKKLAPTSRGRLVDEVLSDTFPDLLEPAYTAQMEDRLDEVAAGKRPWLEELRAWYGPFAQQLGGAPAKMAARLSAHPELGAEPNAVKPTGKSCPLCGKELLLRPRKKGDGSFLACSAYPACTYTANPDARPSGRKCPRCGRELLVASRKDGGGEFLSCPGYAEKNAKGEPACSYIADASAKASEHRCPKCSGPMEELAGQFGPYARCLKADCDGIVELAPLTAELCPFCDAPMRDKGKALSCSRYPECRGYYDKAALARARKDKAVCPECGKPLLRRKGPRGSFLGCAAYPKCRHISHPSTQAKSHAHSP